MAEATKIESDRIRDEAQKSIAQSKKIDDDNKQDLEKESIIEKANQDKINDENCKKFVEKEITLIDVNEEKTIEPTKSIPLKAPQPPPTRTNPQSTQQGSSIPAPPQSISLKPQSKNPPPPPPRSENTTTKEDVSSLSRKHQQKNEVNLVLLSQSNLGKRSKPETEDFNVIEENENAVKKLNIGEDVLK